MSSATLRAYDRLHRTQRFYAIHRRGRWVRGRTLALGWLANEDGPSRLGIRIRKTVAPRAVTRNRLKRLVREAFRHHKTAIRTGHDLLVLINQSGTPAAKDIETEFLTLCQRADLLLP